MKYIVPFVWFSMLAPVWAFGQTSTASQDEVQVRLRALEEQVQTLRAEVANLRAAIATGQTAAPAPPAQEAQAPAPTAAAQPQVPDALATAPTGGETRPAGQLPVYGVATAGAKIFNPDIGMIGNFISTSGHHAGGSDAVAPLPFATLQESELSLQAIVDPFARADFFLALGEEGIEVEEGYVSFPTLPGGLLVKAGKMRANFGRLNAFHNHTLPWVDRPLVMFNLLGGSAVDPDTGIKDAGVSVARLIPAGKLFVEATGEAFRGDSGDLFKSSRRRDFSTIGRLRTYADLSDQTNLETGFSYARGHNDLGSGLLTQLYGLDLTLRWKPLQRAIYRSFTARTELMWSRREDVTRMQSAFGLYASADYQFRRRWFAGARYDQSDRAKDASIRDRGASAVLTFWPSEFSQVRGQYRRTQYGEGRTANELLFQVLFTIGAHGAHPF